MHRFFSSPCLRLVGLVASGASFAFGCGLLVGIEEFEATTIDASSATTSGPNDGGAATAVDACVGFVCGAQCAALGDPHFGCAPERGCAPCPEPPNTTAVCSNVTCTTTCRPGFLDCNGSAADGCEVDATSDDDNCGACDAGCTNEETPDCVDSTCVIYCAPPTRYCQGSCVDIRTSTTHCGVCGNTCPRVSAGVGVDQCVDGGCSVRCPNGTGDCNGVAADGCETNVRSSSVQHCGACAPCPPSAPNATQVTCATDKCKATCQTNFADCDNAVANGCECDLTAGYCNNNACAPCKLVGTSCSGDRECCGFVAGTSYCSVDDDGSFISCATKK